jgi:hypothetical protein
LQLLASQRELSFDSDNFTNRLDIDNFGKALGLCDDDVDTLRAQFSNLKELLVADRETVGRYITDEGAQKIIKIMGGYENDRDDN